MADFAGIFVPPAPGQAQSSTLATVTSTAELVFGNRTRLAIVVTGAAAVRFGNSGMAAASAADALIPPNTLVVFNLGDAYDRIRIFNVGASTINYSAYPLTT